VSRDLLRTALPILAAIMGALASGPLSSSFLTPQAIDREAWNVIFRGDSDQHLRNPRIGEGTQIREGSLFIGQDRFGQSEMVSPKTTSPVGKLVLREHPLSGPIQVAFRLRGEQSGEHVVLTLNQDTFTSTQATQGKRAKHHWELQATDSELIIETASGPLTLHKGPVGTVELSSASNPQARIVSIRIEDPSGNVLAEAGYSPSGLHLGALCIGTFSGLLLGLGGLVLLQNKRRTAALIAATFTILPPLAILRVDPTAWNTLTDKLYLAQIAPTDIALALFSAAHLPVLALLLISTDLLRIEPRRGTKNHWQIWGTCALAMALLALRESWWWAAGIGLFTVLPGWLSYRSRLPPLKTLTMDTPAIVLLGVLGGPVGLLPATLWRLLVLTANRHVILNRSPRSAADYLFVLLLVIPCAIELAVRSTGAQTAWDPQKLALEATTTSVSDWKNPTPYWSDTCGPEDAPDTFHLVFLGGSSAGGAYQFAAEPRAFFPARIHQSLCSQLPENTRLSTFNFAEGGRNSFTFSRAMNRILEQSNADLVVAYMGVNERTADHPWTRKQMEEREVAQTPTHRELGAIAGRSRTIVGLSLLLRGSKSSPNSGKRVAEVPLPDFRENLVSIERAIEEAPLVLVSQVVLGSLKEDLVPYWNVEAELAASIEGVEHIRLDELLPDLDPETSFLDQNHLTRQGHQSIHDALLPKILEATNRQVQKRGTQNSVK